MHEAPFEAQTLQDSLLIQMAPFSIFGQIVELFWDAPDGESACTVEVVKVGSSKKKSQAPGVACPELCTTPIVRGVIPIYERTATAAPVARSRQKKSQTEVFPGWITGGIWRPGTSYIGNRIIIYYVSPLGFCRHSKSRRTGVIHWIWRHWIVIHPGAITSHR